MLNSTEIRSEFQENYRYAHDFWVPFTQAAQVYSLACAGYTWSDQERIQLQKEGREPIEMNIIRRPIQFYSGYLRDNLPTPVAQALEGSDPKTADQLTKMSYYIWDKGKGYSTFLDGADECFKAGICLCGIRMDYSEDFENGDMRFFKRTYNSFYLDPTFEKIDLSDCGFAITRDLVGKKVLHELIPFVDEKEIEFLTRSFRDDKFLSYHPNFTTLSRNRNLVAYDQYYKRTTRTRKFLVDKRTSYKRDITNLQREEIQKLKLGINRFERLRDESQDRGIPEGEIPILEIRDIERPYIELSIMLNGQEVYRGADKTGITKTYPFVPQICYMEPSIWMPSLRIQGIGATQWNNQRYFNSRHMKIRDMMDSDISTGYKYLIGAVPDPQDMQQSGQNRLIGVEGDPSKNPAGLAAIEQLRGGGCNPALLEYQKILNDLSLTLANINESMLGIDDKGNTQISGRLAQVRIAQGLRGGRSVFDNLEEAQLCLGGIVLEAIQINYPAGKIERIIGEKPTQQFYDEEFEQYGAVIKEGVRSQSQKDAYYYEIVNLKREGIVDVPQPEIIRALGMASGSTELKEAIASNEEKMSIEREQMAQINQKKIELLDATKEEKLGLARERDTRSIGNLALKDERESEAQQNIAQAALDRVKAMTEIAKMNDSRILEVLKVINEIERQEAEGRELQKSQVAQQAEEISSKIKGTDENKKLVSSQNELSSGQLNQPNGM